MDETAVKHELYFGDALRIEFHLSNNCVPVTAGPWTGALLTAQTSKPPIVAAPNIQLTLD